MRAESCLPDHLAMPSQCSSTHALILLLTMKIMTIVLIWLSLLISTAVELCGAQISSALKWFKCCQADSSISALHHLRQMLVFRKTGTRSNSDDFFISELWRLLDSNNYTTDLFPHWPGFKKAGQDKDLQIFLENAKKTRDD